MKTPRAAIKLTLTTETLRALRVRSDVKAGAKPLSIVPCPKNRTSNNVSCNTWCAYG